VKQKKFHHFYLLIGILLVTAAVPRFGLAADYADPGDNRLGVTPMGPMTEPAPRYDNERMIVPRPPVQPNAVSRPASWPGGAAPAAQTITAGPVPQSTPESPVELFEGTTILARVGSEAIFAYEIIGGVNEILEKYKDKIPPSQFDMQRAMLIKQRLMSRIETKLIYLDVKRTIPAERLPEVEKQITKYFESTELPNMLKRSGVESARELDQKLQSLGSSLDREKKSFIERTLAQQWVSQQIKRDEEITYDQMLKYYREHQSEFEKPAQAKWEEIMVQLSKYPGKAEAYDAISRLGNQVLGGASFAQVGGDQHNWTTKGSLVCDELDQAIFILPVGQLSKIIESEKGYHIIRVSERVETELTPFLTAQVDIKEKIVQERNARQLREYLDRLEDKIPIWTIYDGDRKNLRLGDRMKEIR